MIPVRLRLLPEVTLIGRNIEISLGSHNGAGARQGLHLPRDVGQPPGSSSVSYFTIYIPPWSEHNTNASRISPYNHTLIWFNSFARRFTTPSIAEAQCSARGTNKEGASALRCRPLSGGCIWLLRSTTLVSPRKIWVSLTPSSEAVAVVRR